MVQILRYEELRVYVVVQVNCSTSSFVKHSREHPALRIHDKKLKSILNSRAKERKIRESPKSLSRTQRDIVLVPVLLVVRTRFAVDLPIRAYL